VYHSIKSIKWFRFPSVYSSNASRSACRTVAIGAGRNAGILAMQILGTSDETIRNKVEDYKLKLLKESQEKIKIQIYSAMNWEKIE
jgi:phosphoribosylcarboxyaminoimidazole (NCAIR) mutase